MGKTTERAASEQVALPGARGQKFKAGPVHHTRRSGACDAREDARQKARARTEGFALPLKMGGASRRARNRHAIWERLTYSTRGQQVALPCEEYNIEICHHTYTHTHTHTTDSNKQSLCCFCPGAPGAQSFQKRSSSGGVVPAGRNQAKVPPTEKYGSVKAPGRGVEEARQLCAQCGAKAPRRTREIDRKRGSQ